MQSALVQTGVWPGIPTRNPKVSFNILQRVHVLLRVKLLPILLFWSRQAHYLRVYRLRSVEEVAGAYWVRPFPSL